MQRNDWSPTKWQAVDPSLLNIDAEKLAELDPIIKASYSNINGIILVRNGYLLSLELPSRKDLSKMLTKRC